MTQSNLLNHDHIIILTRDLYASHSSLLSPPRPPPPNKAEAKAAALQTLNQGFPMLDLGRAILLQSNRLDSNEATGILWAETHVGVHTGLFLAV
jgi:hypothetical protein